MNIGQPKEYIKDLPDDMEIGRHDDDNTCDRLVEQITIEKYPEFGIGFNSKKEYLNFN